jgi:hypothetical protein
VPDKKSSSRNRAEGAMDKAKGRAKEAAGSARGTGASGSTPDVPRTPLGDPSQSAEPENSGHPRPGH